MFFFFYFFYYVVWCYLDSPSNFISSCCYCGMSIFLNLTFVAQRNRIRADTMCYSMYLLELYRWCGGCGCLWCWVGWIVGGWLLGCQGVSYSGVTFMIWVCHCKEHQTLCTCWWRVDILACNILSFFSLLFLLRVIISIGFGLPPRHLYIGIMSWVHKP